MAPVQADGIIWDPRWRDEADKQAHLAAGRPFMRIIGLDLATPGSDRTVECEFENGELKSLRYL